MLNSRVKLMYYLSHFYYQQISLSWEQSLHLQNPWKALLFTIDGGLYP